VKSVPSVVHFFLGAALCASARCTGQEDLVAAGGAVPLEKSRPFPRRFLPQRTQRTQREELMTFLLCDLCVLCGSILFGCGVSRAGPFAAQKPALHKDDSTGNVEESDLAGSPRPVWISYSQLKI